ncbi:hypothetical protein Metho_1404 [Methanomethylovorans hollandica DSM 15978]|jgi:putative membrane protein|uniref:Uncharacterized protein n=1 Tax=Methanomethylovorans hollandica (strain DSM 15978 / NBRC 107637 / DMS1) TaxID=867904 RepID=L0L031_METHD|nr:hypothetical protein [Methanomethylovorans hollandica]AGB49614.1 hypothetical protein Metho_1404 [Methanomethylovorans hollandica DSM 15978]
MVDVTGIFGNIGLQLFILMLLAFSAYQARSKKMKIHCNLMAAALFLQLLTIVFVMSPSFLAHSGMQISIQLLLELWVHHIAGILVMLLVIYINLAVKGSVHFLGEPYRLMKPVALLWFLVLLGGMHISISLYPDL